MDPEESPPDGRPLWERTGALTRSERRMRRMLLIWIAVLIVGIVVSLILSL